MSPVMIILIATIILLFSAIGIYFIIDYRKELIDIRRVRKHARNGDKLLIDYYRMDKTIAQTDKATCAEVYSWVPHDT